MNLLNNASIFQTFDKAYELAQQFMQKYAHDTNWEEQELDYDEAIEQFVKENQ